MTRISPTKRWPQSCTHAWSTTQTLLEELTHEWTDRRAIVRSTLRYADVFFRRASNVGFADAEIVEDSFRHVPFLTVAPPASLRIGSMLRWMLPSVNAMGRLVEQGRICARRALAGSQMVRGIQTVRDQPTLAPVPPSR